MAAAWRHMPAAYATCLVILVGFSQSLSTRLPLVLAWTGVLALLVVHASQGHVHCSSWSSRQIAPAGGALHRCLLWHYPLFQVAACGTQTQSTASQVGALSRWCVLACSLCQ
jgi:hypothetical protein